ncbi:MAG: formate/nitrite transporter family protein [Pseudomonadota bacterium]
MSGSNDDRAGAREGFAPRELDEIEAAAAVRPPVVFETIRRQGREEMSRPTTALALSGVAAGIAMGFSVLAQGVLMVALPEGDLRPVVAALGYSLGFLIVILGQMQLFTENTITPVTVALERPTPAVFACLGRLWAVVFLANIVGAALFAAAMVGLRLTEPEVLEAMVDLGRHATEKTFWETLARGMPAGWLIAALVWLSPTAGNARALMIIAITWLIALAGFTHVVAGSAKAALMVFTGAAEAREVYLGYVVPAVLGNVIGGSALFTLLVWGQIRTELPPATEAGRETATETATGAGDDARTDDARNPAQGRATTDGALRKAEA